MVINGDVSGPLIGGGEGEHWKMPEQEAVVHDYVTLVVGGVMPLLNPR